MTTTLTHFAYRIDMWDANGENIVEHPQAQPACERAVVDHRRRVRAANPRIQPLLWGPKQKPQS